MYDGFYGHVLKDLLAARIIAVAFFLTSVTVGVSLGVAIADNESLKHQITSRDKQIEYMQDMINDLRIERDKLKELLPIKAQNLDELIEGVARSFNLPPGFIKAIALIESDLSPYAINVSNKNGTRDYGLMQLNDSWFNTELWSDAYTNLIAACIHIAQLRKQCDTWWRVAIAYNAGIARANDPPKKSLDYAALVMAKWNEFEPYSLLNKGGR